MKGAPGLAGHVPPGRGGLWSTRPRPQPLTLPALPVGELGLRRAKRRTARRAQWRHARRSEAAAAGRPGRRLESPRRVWGRAASPVPPGGRAGCAAQAQAWLMSIGLVRRARLYPPIQLYSVIARQGPPAHLTNRGGSRELGFLPGLLGIAHGIAHEVAHGIAETHGTTDSEQRRGSRHPRSAPSGLGAGTRIDGSPLGEDRRLRTPHPGLHKRRGERRVEAPRPTLKEKESRDWKGPALTSWRVSRTAQLRAGLRLRPHSLASHASVLHGRTD
jgi:hypothetical protein